MLVMVTARSTGRELFQINNGVSHIVVDLLKVLKDRYNYKKLSNLTGIPISTLTRYLTGKTIPKGSKARRLLKNLVLNLNLSSLISQLIRDGDSIDLFKVMFNPNMIKIIGAHVINEYVGMKITSFMALDLLSIPLTAYLSTVTSRHFYIVAREPLPVDNQELFTIFLNDSRSIWPTCYWVYFNQARKKESILMVSAKTPEYEFFNKLIEVLEKKNVEIAGLFSLIGSEEEFSKLSLKPGCKRYCILS
jgi:transcriptional regulator with XRE-family HTH domain